MSSENAERKNCLYTNFSVTMYNNTKSETHKVSVFNATGSNLFTVQKKSQKKETEQKEKESIYKKIKS